MGQASKAVAVHHRRHFESRDWASHSASSRLRLVGGVALNFALHSKGEHRSFGSVVGEISAIHDVIVLASPDQQALVGVCPSLQGRVLTSSADGEDGPGFGWVNTPLIRSGQIQPHFNAYGGEDRLWIGPEGGQYSVFFAPGTSFDLKHWNTPPPVDTEPFELVKRSDRSVITRKQFDVLNYSGTHFKVQIDREISLLTSEQVWADLHVAPQSGLKLVGYESRNRMTNVGTEWWSKKKGLLSLWILGQFEASPEAIIVIPIRSGDDHEFGKRVTSDYFGQVPADRLAVQPTAVFMKADAGFRAKLGINPLRTTGVLGSYDAGTHVLTIIQFTTHPGNSDYVNSLWKIQDRPYEGDVANAYNDGPLANDKAGLGHFYELESSSPAAPLAPGASVEHMHRTIHLVGKEQALNQVSRTMLGVNMKKIRDSLESGSRIRNDNGQEN
jgi:hypothetical protein